MLTIAEIFRSIVAVVAIVARPMLPYDSPGVTVTNYRLVDSNFKVLSQKKNQKQKFFFDVSLLNVCLAC